MKKNLKASAALLAAVLLLCGCSTDISDTVPKPTEPPVKITLKPKETTAESSESSEESTPEPAEETTVSTTTTAETTEVSEEITTEPIDEEYSSFTFSDEYNDFLTHSVFVGDSICMGLKVYDVLPAKKVVAQGNVAARNIFDFTFRVDGDEMSILAALVNLKPKNIIFSMGMNDVNITSEKKFCENYTNLLSLTESFLPDAKLYVCSVTPVTIESKFTANENIDSFNAALKKTLDESEKWTYIDITREMKNSLNAMKTLYNGGDGVHLSKSAYYAMLYQVCERAVDNRIYDEDGIPWIIDENGDLIREDGEPAETSKTDNTDEASGTSASSDGEADAESSETPLESDEITTLPPTAVSE